jgi:hypothetical protein
MNNQVFRDEKEKNHSRLFKLFETAVWNDESKNPNSICTSFYTSDLSENSYLI